MPSIKDKMAAFQAAASGEQSPVKKSYQKKPGKLSSSYKKAGGADIASKKKVTSSEADAKPKKRRESSGKEESQIEEHTSSTTKPKIKAPADTTTATSPPGKKVVKKHPPKSSLDKISPPPEKKVVKKHPPQATSNTTSTPDITSDKASKSSGGSSSPRKKLPKSMLASFECSNPEPTSPPLVHSRKGRVGKESPGSATRQPKVKKITVDSGDTKPTSSKKSSTGDAEPPINGHDSHSKKKKDPPSPAKKLKTKSPRNNEEESDSASAPSTPRRQSLDQSILANEERQPSPVFNLSKTITNSSEAALSKAHETKDDVESVPKLTSKRRSVREHVAQRNGDDPDSETRPLPPKRSSHVDQGEEEQIHPDDETAGQYLKSNSEAKIDQVSLKPTTRTSIRATDERSSARISLPPKVDDTATRDAKGEKDVPISKDAGKEKYQAPIPCETKPKETPSKTKATVKPQTATRQAQPAVPPRGTTGPGIVSPASPVATHDGAGDGKKSFLLLVSEFIGNHQQRANQDRVKVMLRNLPHSTLDGADPANKEQRNELFGMSGIRGNYPQLFVVEGSPTSFVGDFDTIECMNEDGQLKDIVKD